MQTVDVLYGVLWLVALFCNVSGFMRWPIGLAIFFYILSSGLLVFATKIRISNGSETE